jgi:4-azaleucine resistance transporter AzlC
MSLFVYAGSMQFIAVNFFINPLGLAEAALMTLLVNIRHMFYGLSLLDRFNKSGKLKPYLIFSLTDETYSLLCSVKTPQGVDEGKFLFSIALLNQLYWVTGTAVGLAAGSLIRFNTRGIDFAMTALFIVIFIEQWLSASSHAPALVGFFCAAASLFIIGRDNMVLPAMLIMTAILVMLRGPVDARLNDRSGGGGS